MDQCLPALSCCLKEESSSKRKSSLSDCLKTIGARDIVPGVEEDEEGSSRLAYKVRAALAGLLEVSDAIQEGRMRTEFCAMCYAFMLDYILTLDILGS